MSSVNAALHGDIDALAALGLRFPACDEAIIRIVNDTRELRMTRRWNIGCIM